MSTRLLWRYPEWWTVTLSALAWLVLVIQAGHHAFALETWLLMVLAMMVPLVLYPIRLAAGRSLWQRRHRAIAGFLLGYLGPWLVLGALVAAVDAALGLDHVPLWLGGIGFAIAAAWQLAPLRLRALRSCHRSLPLAPRGWRADWDCLRFGWLTGGQCVLSCWALMLACVLAGHTVLAMVCVSAIGVAERYFVQPGQRFVSFSPLLAIALVYGILGL